MARGAGDIGLAPEARHAQVAEVLDAAEQHAGLQEGHTLHRPRAAAAAAGATTQRRRAKCRNAGSVGLRGGGPQAGKGGYEAAALRRRGAEAGGEAGLRPNDAEEEEAADLQGDGLQKMTT